MGMWCKCIVFVSLWRYCVGMTRDRLVGPATAYIAGELRAQKARHNWTFDDVAERSGVARSTVERTLKGEHAIAVEVLIPLCDAMGLDVRVLVSEAATLDQ